MTEEERELLYLVEQTIGLGKRKIHLCTICNCTYVKFDENDPKIELKCPRCGTKPDTEIEIIPTQY
jgi:hypothetical protein